MKLVDAAVDTGLGALKIAAIVVLIVAFVAWARAAPDQAQAVLTKVMDMAASIIIWGCDQIINLTGVDTTAA